MIQAIQRIRKIKFLKEGKIRLIYDLTNGDELDVKYKDDPRPEFRETMTSLIPPVLELLELPADYDEGMTATGISLSWTEGIMGAVVTLQKEIAGAHAPVVINTPHLPEAPYGEGADDSCLLSGELVDGLRDCMREAEAYIRGQRAQMDLFAGNGKDDEKEGEIEEVSEPQSEEVLQPV